MSCPLGSGTGSLRLAMVHIPQLWCGGHAVGLVQAATRDRRLLIADAVGSLYKVGLLFSIVCIVALGCESTAEVLLSHCS